MEFKIILEENRKKALDTNNSVWVAASAGSGKTKILVDRLLALLINDVDISKVVCITYTKTGAHEMKERIYSELASWVLLDDEALKIKIRSIVNLQNITKNFLEKSRTLFAKVIDNIENLKIFTIHSFCQQIISRFPIEAGILPNFEVIEDFKVKELITQAKQEVFLNIDKNSSFYKCIKKLVIDNNENQFDDLLKFIINDRKYFEIMEQFDYMEDLKNLFNISYESEEKILEEFFSADFSNILNAFENVSEEYFTNTTDLLNLENKKDEKDKIDKYLKIFLTDKFEKRDLTRLKKEFKEIKEGRFKETFLLEQDRCYKLKQDLENQKYYELSVAVIAVAFSIIDRYRKLKDKKGYLDFDDLIVITLKLLENTEYSAWVNYKLDNGIEHVLVDEAQDTSLLQWKIVENLTGDFFAGETKNENERTLFVVGDEKQSIFSFQGANPSMFNERYTYYKYIIESCRKIFHKVDLQYSFRSVETVLQFVDAVFKDRVYAEKISKLNAKIIHKNIREGLGLVELWPKLKIEKKNEEPWSINFDETEETETLKFLADCIVKKIKYLLNSNRAIVDRKTGQLRKIKAGDIMILFKKRNYVFLSYLIKGLNKNCIANSGYDKIDLFDDIIIQDFISLFNFVIFQEDDLNLANLVKSPFLNLTEDDLYDLCKIKNEKQINLFEVIKLEEKYKKQYDFLMDIIEKSKNFGIYDLYFYLLENCNIRIKILERFGNDANEILNNFSNFIKNYEKNNATGTLLSFLYYIENNENEIKKDLESKDLVRIMTIHNSKGMQAPVVFITSCESKITKGQKDLFFWNKMYNYKLSVYKKGASYCNIIKNIKEDFTTDEHEEYFRLFYVALTRAENELYLCSGSYSKEKEKSIEEKEEEKNTTWYDVSRLAMENLGAKEEKFEYDEEQNKFVFGKENFIENKIDNLLLTDTTDNSEELRKILEYKPMENKSEKVITPSQFYSHTDKDDLYTKLNINILKGNAVHKLLEILPNTKIEDREKIMDICLTNSFSKLENGEKKEIKDIVKDILENENFKKFFVQNSKSELEIVGKIEDNGEEFMVSGKIDRLAEYEDKILILDYKNSSKHYERKEDLPKEYIKQLELYKKLMEKIYKNKEIECYILVTTWGELIKVW